MNIPFWLHILLIVTTPTIALILVFVVYSIIDGSKQAELIKGVGAFALIVGVAFAMIYGMFIAEPEQYYDPDNPLTQDAGEVRR